jgi:hypothetical protein
MLPELPSSAADAAIDASPSTPSAADSALAALRSAIRQQILVLASQEITPHSLDRLQRFCASSGTALIGLENPHALVRQRFGIGGPLGVGGSMTNDFLLPSDAPLAGAPAEETYGANATRGLVESMSAAAERVRRAVTVPQLVESLANAKRAKLPRTMIKQLERKLEEMLAVSQE